MKSGDRESVIVFGEEAVVDQPLAAPADGGPTEGPGERAAAPTSSRRIQLAQATLPPGQANRIVMLTDGRQNAGNALAAAQAAKDAGVDLYYVRGPPHVHPGGRGRVDGAAARGEVRRALPGQGGGVEPQGHRRGGSRSSATASSSARRSCG